MNIRSFSTVSTLLLGVLISLFLVSCPEDIVEPEPVLHVIYLANGADSGSVPVDSTDYAPAATVLVAGNSGLLANTGFTFTGWNTAADGSGSAYQPGDTFTIGSADVTLYAQWVEVTGSLVTYQGNGHTSGAAPLDATSYSSGAPVTVLGNSGSLAKTGFTFTGWNTAADGSGTAYQPGDTFTIGSADVTLYAQWEALPQCTLAYEGNGHTSGSPPAATSFAEGSQVLVADASDLTKTGFTFTGWNTAADGSGTAYQPGDTFTIGSADVTLYAQWEALPQCTLAYEGNGHTSGTPPQNNSVYYAGDGVIVDDQATLLCDNHTFAGWNTAADGSGTTYTPGDVLTMGTVDITLYAQWDDGYYLTYDGNGHTGGAPPGTMWFDPLVHTTPLTVAELGTLEKLQNGILLYFLEWNTQSDGTGTSYAPGDDLTLSGPLTLYAIWQILGGTGPADGTIFYDKGSYSDGWRYLELAPVSTETTAQWGASGTFLGAYDEKIGTGLTNTALIADSLDSNGETGRAAQICQDLEVGGYDDWFLPSINELWKVFDIKYLGYGDIVLGGMYWSSTESWQQQTEAKALQLNASSASIDYPQKTADRYVRAVRRF